jgi:hypothetical protein
MAKGHFYPQLPTNIGGKQPYAPRLGVVPSAPVVANQLKPSNVWFSTVLAIHRNQPWTLIYTASIAPLLATPPTIDNPPPRSNANLNVIARSWLAREPWRDTTDYVAPFAPAPVISPPPVKTLENVNTIRAWNNPRVWWPLPTNIKQTPPSAAAPDAPPKRSYANLNIVIASWKAPPPRPVFKNAPSTESAPPPVGSDGEVFMHLRAHFPAHKRAIRFAHGNPLSWPS